MGYCSNVHAFNLYLRKLFSKIRRLKLPNFSRYHIGGRRLTYRRLKILIKVLFMRKFGGTTVALAQPN